MSKQEIYNEFKTEVSIKSDLDCINSSLDYEHAVNDIVDSVLESAIDCDIDIYDLISEVVASSKYTIYTRYHSGIYDHSDHDESSLAIELSSYNSISEALIGFAFCSLEQDILNNDYIQEIIKIDEQY